MSQRVTNRIHACPVETSMELLSGKWKPRILWKLHKEEIMRFGELRRGMPQVTAKMLTQQLRELEKDGLITRTVYAQVPPKVEYSLSSLGCTLKPVLDMIAQWGVENQQEIVNILQSIESEPESMAG